MGPGPPLSAARRPSLRAVGREAAILLFFAGLAALATRPLAGHLSSETISGYDPLSHLWTVHWLVEHFGGAEMFEGNLFFPARHAVLFTDIDLGSVVLVLPLRPLLHDPVPLFNLALLGALAFGAWSFHLLVRSLTGRLSAGLLAGILVGFSSHTLHHLHHLNLLSTGWLGLFLLGLHRTLKDPGPWSAVLTGVSFSLAAQSSGYYGAVALVLAPVFAATAGRSLARRRQIFTVAAAALVAALVTAPYATAFWSLRSERALRRGLGWSESLSFHPGSDLGSESYLYGALLGREGECLFPGLLCLSLAPLAFRRGADARFYAAAVVVLCALSLPGRVSWGSRELWLPFSWLHAVPPFDSLRHPYTFAAVGVSLLGVLAGLGFASLPLSRHPGASALVLLAACLETLAPPPVLQAVPHGLPAIYERLLALPRGPVLEVSNPDDDDGSVLLHAARCGFPFLNGQLSAYVPRQTRQLYDFLSKVWLQDTPAVMDLGHASFLLDNYPVRYLVVRRPHMGALGRALDASGLFRKLAQTAEGDRLYEVLRPAAGP